MPKKKKKVEWFLLYNWKGWIEMLPRVLVDQRNMSPPTNCEKSYFEPLGIKSWKLCLLLSPCLSTFIIDCEDSEAYQATENAFL